MTIVDPNDFEKEIEVPSLGEQESLPEIIQHIAVVSEAIDKCEKILQHLALGNYSADFQKYMSAHIRLTSQKNALYKRKKELEGNDLS